MVIVGAPAFGAIPSRRGSKGSGGPTSHRDATAKMFERAPGKGKGLRPFRSTEGVQSLGGAAKSRPRPTSRATSTGSTPWRGALPKGALPKGGGSIPNDLRKRKFSEMAGATAQMRRPLPVSRNASNEQHHGPVGGGLQASSETDAVEWLSKHWGTSEDVAVGFSLSTASLVELQKLIDTGFYPDCSDLRRSCAEQVNNRLIQNRELLGPGGGALDVAETFKSRWGLSCDDVTLLRSLCHKDLQHVLQSYDGSRTIQDLSEEAAVMEPLIGRLDDGAPYAPGCSTIGRFIRLELTDPYGDAVVLGDANLSFSLLLARHRKTIGHVGGMIATTFESLEQLRERYEEINVTIQELQNLGCEVWHGVDCTRLAIDSRFQGFEERFTAVYYNFPHAGAVRGFFDAHPFVRWRHENLMQFFFRALRAFVKPGGWVKVSSNSAATGVRYSDITGAATLNEFDHVETVPFQQWHLRRYNRSFGDKRDARKRLEGESSYTSQRADKDMVYAFRYRPTGVQPPRALIKRPPACRDLLTATCACKCGFICPAQMKGSETAKFHFKPGQHQELEGKDKQLVIAELYKRFLSEVSGRHVG